MPRQSVFKYVCDRCGRTWFPEAREGEEPPETRKLKLLLVGKDGETMVEVTYDTLCESCEKTVENYVTGVANDLKNKSPKRGAKKKGTGKRGAEAPRPQPGTADQPAAQDEP
jgi:hypothetical protein